MEWEYNGKEEKIFTPFFEITILLCNINNNQSNIFKALNTETSKCHVKCPLHKCNPQHACCLLVPMGPRKCDVFSTLNSPKRLLIGPLTFQQESVRTHFIPFYPLRDERRRLLWKINMHRVCRDGQWGTRGLNCSPESPDKKGKEELTCDA